MSASLVGSEMCIRDSPPLVQALLPAKPVAARGTCPRTASSCSPSGTGDGGTYMVGMVGGAGPSASSSMQCTGPLAPSSTHSSEHECNSAIRTTPMAGTPGCRATRAELVLDAHRLADSVHAESTQAL
eukprot:6188446-Alexandrium_andersonii.AAC.1